MMSDLCLFILEARMRFFSMYKYDCKMSTLLTATFKFKKSKRTFRVCCLQLLLFTIVKLESVFTLFFVKKKRERVLFIMIWREIYVSFDVLKIGSPLMNRRVV